jgi:hypothetical protein
MVYQDPVDYAPAYVDGQPLYNDPGYAIDPNASVMYDNAPDPVYDNGGMADPSYVEPNTYVDQSYVEPQQIDAGQDAYVEPAVAPDTSYDDSPVDNYSGGGDDYATVDNSGDSGWSDGGGGGDDWS